MAADGDGEWWLEVPPESLQVALTLAQTTWWVDSESTPHLVDAMSADHRTAVLSYLQSRSRELLLAVQETEARARPGGAVGRAARVLLGDGVDLRDHETWLELTPLIRRLRLLGRRTP